MSVSPQASSQRQPQRGFSMIELIIVGSIILILAAVSAPAIARYFQNFRIRGAAQQLATDIASARGRAISKNTNFGVVFVVLAPGAAGNPSATDVAYRFGLEDDVVPPITQVRPTTTTLLTNAAWTQNLSPLRTLPNGVTFATTTPPLGGAPNNRGLRFTRLGAMCNPGSDVNLCPPMDAGTNYVYFDGNNDAYFVLTQARTGLNMEIKVSAGGRVTFTRTWK